MGTHLDLHHNGSLIRYDSDVLNPIEPRLFDVGWPKAEGYHRGTSSGRGEAHFLSFAGRDMVLRPFRRGGLVGRFNRDLYMRKGLEATRSMREFELLSWLYGEGLPVPRPLAAKVTPVGLFYRAAILTERIPQARPIEELLQSSALDEECWRRVGCTVRRMHDAGVYHSDLNCRNILIDNADRAWLIDFDKCERRPPGRWTQANLERLERSLLKSANSYANFKWRREDWAHLLTGYAGETESA